MTLMPSAERRQNGSGMRTIICHQCRFANLQGAQHCVSCGSPLGDANVHASGAIWLDTTPSTFDVRPEQVTVPMPVELSFRELPEDAPVVDASTCDIPLLHDALEPALPPQAGARPAKAPAPAAPPRTPPAHVDDDAWLAAERAAKRAFVRRARRRNGHEAHAAQPPMSEVLVFDRDPATRDRLFGLLTGFGFGVLAADTLAEAAAMAHERHFVAAFVDVPLGTAGDDPGVALCRQVKDVAPPPGGSGTLLVWVGTRLRPVERVRAELAGCDALLVKPLSRSDVARVLDQHNVAMPADPRQG